MKGLLAVLSVVFVALACNRDEPGHDHSDQHPTGHDHHEEGHGHGDTPVVATTLWSDDYELFAEHGAAVAGKPVDVLAHVTVLEGFTPLRDGRVSLEMTGPASVTAQPNAKPRAGIYAISITLPKPGVYRGRLRVDGPVPGAIEGLRIEAFADAASAKASRPPSRDHAGLIELLKEQQWALPFATAFARTGTLTPSIEVAGRIATPPDGTGEVSAPVPGRLVAPRTGLPRPGAVLKKGQLLATVLPTPSSPEQAARTRLAVTEATARAAAADLSLERARRLFEDEAISKRELEEAERESAVAAKAVEATKAEAAVYSGASSATGSGGWRLVAPISGTLVEVHATPGATVSPDDMLFRIVDPSELWISAEVPEQDAARLKAEHDAAFRVAGSDAWQSIPVASQSKTAALVTISRAVDPVSRTVRVIYSLAEPGPALRVGGLVTVSLPVGETFTGVVVPREAIVDRDGRSVAYVQVDGEHFSEHSVRTGATEAGRVGILSGLDGGERVVVRGAHLVRLAEGAKGGEAHGHIH